jgi:hypothetical protein
MEKLIRDRLSTIVSLILGSGSGWGFTEILTAPELKTWLITISVAVSFLLSLIISLSLVGRITKAKRKKIIKQAIMLFSAFIVAVALFFIIYGKYTVALPAVNDSGQIDTTIVVKGLFYTPAAKVYRDSERAKSRFKLYPTDEALLEDATFDITKVWSNNARIYARLMLLALYTIMISLFIAGVTLTTEVIVRSKKQPQ